MKNRMLNKGLAYVLAASFLFSAYTKAIAPGFFELTLIDQHLASTRLVAAWMTRVIIGVEAVLGLALMWGISLRHILKVVLFLLVVFTAHLGYLWGQGDTENCGCFGTLLAMNPWQSMLKNLALLGISIYLFRHTKAQPIRWFSISGLSLLVMILTLAALPIKTPEAVAFQAFHQFERAGRVDLLSGEKLVAIFNLDCEHCQELATELGQLQRNHPTTFPDTYVLFFQEGNTTPEVFEEMTQTQFPFQMIDLETFFDMIGNSPPRLYFLNSGAIEAVIDTDYRAFLAATFGLVD